MSDRKVTRYTADFASFDATLQGAMENLKKPIGRPREFDGTVSIRLPKELHDALSREALKQDRRLSDVIRDRLARQDENGSRPATR